MRLCEGISRWPPVCTFDFQHKELFWDTCWWEGSRLSSQHLWFLYLYLLQLVTGFLVLYSTHKLLRLCGFKKIPGGQVTCSKAQPGLLPFPCLLSKKWTARPLSASAGNRDKEEGTCGLFLKQNGEQAGLAKRSGNGSRGSVSSLET